MSKKLTTIFPELSKGRQAKLEAYAQKLQEAEMLEREAEKLDREIRDLETDLSHNTNDPPEYSPKGGKRRKRPHAQDTVRRNFSMSKEIANATQAVSKSKGMTASLYLERVLGRQQEIIDFLENGYKTPSVDE